MHTTNPLYRALLSLNGLSVGDAFGGYFFGASTGAARRIVDRILPVSPWYFTDDTNMALSVFAILKRYAAIDQDRLAFSFAEHYDRSRGYGPAMHRLLRQLGAGVHWRDATKLLFSGQGSFGNGSAMRVAPIGAYFVDDLDLVIQNAKRSAEVTHSHPEAIAGAIAVAVAAAWAWRLRGSTPTRAEFIDHVLPSIPDSEVRSKCQLARDITSHDVHAAVGMLGNGSQISCQDTVPFCLWCAGEHLDNYEEALWLTVSGDGDVDTNCAIVGGIVTLSAGNSGIPSAWLTNREPLPNWAFAEA
jgi:ADP-ribosylglycohydrolase